MKTPDENRIAELEGLLRNAYKRIDELEELVKLADSSRKDWAAAYLRLLGRS